MEIVCNTCGWWGLDSELAELKLDWQNFSVCCPQCHSTDLEDASEFDEGWEWTDDMDFYN